MNYLDLPEKLVKQLDGPINQPVWPMANPYFDGIEGRSVMNWIADDIIGCGKDNMPVVFISCHVSSWQIARLLIQNALQSKGVFQSTIDDERSYSQVSECLALFKNIPLYIDDREYQSLEEVVAAIRHYSDEKGVKTFYVDLYHIDEPEQLSAQITAFEELTDVHYTDPLQFDDDKALSINYLISPICLD